MKRGVFSPTGTQQENLPHPKNTTFFMKRGVFIANVQYYISK